MEGSLAQERYKARFHHYGAMIDEMRLLITLYDPNEPKEQWIARVIENNLMGKRSRNWVRELIVGVFFPRFVNGKYPDAYKDIKKMEGKGADSHIIKSMMYFHTAIYDKFLYDFVTQELYEKYYLGYSNVTANDVYDFIQSKPSNAFNREWSEYVKRRLSRGIMATLRDFEILEGKANKRIASYHIPIEVFLYVAYLLQKDVKSGEKLANHPDWKLFLMNERLTERMFLEGHQKNLVHYEAAGGIVRIEFPYKRKEDLLDGLMDK